MIGYLEGTVLLQKEGQILCALKWAHSQIGFQVWTPQRQNYVWNEGEQVSLWIQTVVREQEISFYGFQSVLEKELFQAFLEVKGVGPKGALHLLSLGEPKEVIHFVCSKKTEAIQRAHGIGKRTAERIILELREKFQKKYPGFPKKGAHEFYSHQGEKSSLFEEALEALGVLGVEKMHAMKLLERVFQKEQSLSDVALIVKKALQVNVQEKSFLMR